MQRAFEDVEGIIPLLRERFWGASFSEKGRFIASDDPVGLDGPRGEMVGFKNADAVFYPVSSHVFLTGTLQRVKQPPITFNYIAPDERDDPSHGRCADILAFP